MKSHKLYPEEHNFIKINSLIKTNKAKIFICGDDLNRNKRLYSECASAGHYYKKKKTLKGPAFYKTIM